MNLDNLAYKEFIESQLATHWGSCLPSSWTIGADWTLFPPNIQESCSRLGARGWSRTKCKVPSQSQVYWGRRAVTKIPHDQAKRQDKGERGPDSLPWNHSSHCLVSWLEIQATSLQTTSNALPQGVAISALARS